MVWWGLACWICLCPTPSPTFRLPTLRLVNLCRCGDWVACEIGHPLHLPDTLWQLTHGVLVVVRFNHVAGRFPRIDLLAANVSCSNTDDYLAHHRALKSGLHFTPSEVVLPRLSHLGGIQIRRNAKPAKRSGSPHVSVFITPRWPASASCVSFPPAVDRGILPTSDSKHRHAPYQTPEQYYSLPPRMQYLGYFRGLFCTPSINFSYHWSSSRS